MKNTPENARFGVEQLEQRLLLAGNVTFAGIQTLPLGIGAVATVDVTGAEAEITIGRNTDGQLFFDGTSNDTTFTIGNLTSTFITLNDAQTAALDSAALGFGINGVNSVGIELNIDTDLNGNLAILGGDAGEDHITVNNDASIDGNVFARTQGGDDTFTVETDGSVDGNVDAQLGLSQAGNDDQGDDDVIIDGTVTGDVTFVGGNGDNSVEVNGEVEGDVDSTTGDGEDSVEVDGGTVGGDLDVESGADTDTVKITGGGEVSGDVDVELGGGDDTADIGIGNGEEVGGDVTVSTGDGEDTVGLDADAGGDVSVDLGADNDTLTADSGNADFEGSVEILAGAGDDTVNITGNNTFEGDLNVDLGDDGTFGDELTLAGFTAEENVAIASGGNTTGNGVSINDGAIWGDLDITQTDGAGFFTLGDGGLLDIGGNVSIDTGSDNDSVTFDDVEVDGTTSVVLGASADFLELKNATTFNDNATFNGGDSDLDEVKGENKPTFNGGDLFINFEK